MTLKVRNLSKSYSGRQILQNVNFDVQDGEVLCIVGPSGAGKTTLLRCITGLEEADSGQIEIDDQVINPDNLKGEIGVVFQDFNLFPNLSIEENVTLAPIMVAKMAKEEAIAVANSLLDRLGLNKVKKLYPYQLSGGQKQRVALARALAMKPKILCYDEPTSALDSGMRSEVEKMVLNLKKDGKTQLIITHDDQFAQNVADSIWQVKAL